VEDGVELLDYLSGFDKSAGEAGASLPALILLDLNMPRKDGRQALMEIKSIPSFQHIPIVVLTTSREEKDMAFSRSMGASSFITKPAAFDEWIDMMKSLAQRWLEPNSSSVVS
jgi:CheY-like chemotaxis protein